MKSPLAQVFRDPAFNGRSPSPSPFRSFATEPSVPEAPPSEDSSPSVVYASRAAFLAGTMGYSKSMCTVLDFVVSYVPPAFWSKELTRYGFKEKHLDALLGALLNDHAELH